MESRVSVLDCAGRTGEKQHFFYILEHPSREAAAANKTSFDAGLSDVRHAGAPKRRGDATLVERPNGPFRQEGLMITVEYPPAARTLYIATTHMRLFMCLRAHRDEVRGERK